MLGAFFNNKLITYFIFIPTYFTNCGEEVSVKKPEQLCNLLMHSFLFLTLQ